MLLVIQFPLADLRSFLGQTSRLDAPAWTQLGARPEFLRYFGRVQERTAGGIEGWHGAGENIVCEANRALSLRASASYLDRPTGYRLPLRRAFGRFFFDGYAVGKYELGLATKSHHGATATGEQLRAVVQHVLKLPVQVRSPLAAPKGCPLGQAGGRLAQLYLDASTNNKQRAQSPPAAWHVLAGNPLLFLEYEAQDQIEVPASAEAVALPPAYGLSLHQYRVQFADRRMHMWLFGIQAAADRKKARMLRLFLLRLHAEQECLGQVLRSLKPGRLEPVRGSKSSEELQGYFVDATDRIKGWESDSEQQFTAEIAKLARGAVDQLNPGAVNTLLASVERWDPRRFVLEKIKDCLSAIGNGSTVNVNYSEGNMSIDQGDRVQGDKVQGDKINVSGTSGGVVNIKSTFGDITQTVGSMAGADQATRDELKKLVEQLGALLQKAPAGSAEDAEAVADAAKLAVEAAAKPKPNKTMVQITADGLKKAAENIKAVLPDVLIIATQIAATVLKVAGVAAVL